MQREQSLTIVALHQLEQHPLHWYSSPLTLGESTQNSLNLPEPPQTSDKYNLEEIQSILATPANRSVELQPFPKIKKALNSLVKQYYAKHKP